MEPKLIGTLDTDYGLGYVYRSGYRADEDFPAVFIDHAQGDRIATLTIYLDNVVLLPGELLVKTWEENERVAKQALASGLFEDTGKRVPTGYVEAQVWRFKDATA